MGIWVNIHTKNKQTKKLPSIHQVTKQSAEKEITGRKKVLPKPWQSFLFFSSVAQQLYLFVVVVVVYSF